MSRKRRKQQTRALLDIVIPVRNGFDHLEKCLRAIPEARGSLPTQVIICDNGSDKDKAREFYKEVSGAKIITYTQPLGFPKACNLGTRQGQAPLILFLNSDVVMNALSLELMVTAMDDPAVGVVGAKLLFAAHTPHGPAGTIQHVCLTTNLRGDFYHPFMAWSADNPRPNRVREVPAVTGACFMTRRNLWKQVGGFDEGYGAGTYEEVHYCMQMESINKKVICETKALGTHYVGASFAEANEKAPLQENRQRFNLLWDKQINWHEWRVL